MYKTHSHGLKIPRWILEVRHIMAPSWYSFFALLLSCASTGFAGTLCTPAEVSKENFGKLGKANNDLALKIHRQLATGSSDNIFFSPLSLSTAFGMLYYGTKGETAKELRKVLGYETADLPEELVHQVFQQYLTESLPSRDPSAYVLNSANAVLLDEHLDLVSSYKTDVQDLYQASVKDVDFLTQATQLVDEINDWVKEKTKGKIDKLLTELDPSTALVLLNAIYFKGTWKTQFDPSDTSPWIFYNNGLESQSKKVPMMRLTEEFRYAALDDLQALEMPYKGDNISMVILLPNHRDGLESLEKSLTPKKLHSVGEEMETTEVHLTLPKFKLEYSREMSGDFQAAGARRIFSPGADLSGIASTPNLFVTEVHHKAVVEVNEEGSEAAAVTGIITSRMGDMSPHFVVDRPFLFAIVDRRNGMILFLGRVTNL